ncbi:Uma2 family endonuclease [Saccharothrix deserti]|uniref:Uma2 family endonuclease n=1 Tax=Saccharothrix deserti TaxID=2593674 RepID=UPI00131DE72E|nr:Uma2 family endonuclease [Saccharothrix deserti]
MSAALQDPMIGPHTIEDWLDLPPSEDGSRTELIFGYFYVTPPPSGEHQVVAFNLAVTIRDALRAAERRELHVVPGVGVKISSTMRTALIPDVVVLDRRPVGASFPPEALIMAVEIWSPGNKRAEREAKMAAYASAGVPFVWTIEQRAELNLTSYRLVQDHYVAENTVREAGPTTITAAPVPVTVDLDAVLDS